MVGLDVAVAAVLTASVALGWLSLTGEQVAAVVAAVTAVSAVVAGLVRARVRPVVTSMSVVDAATWAEAGYYVGAVDSLADDSGGAEAGGVLE